MKKILLVLVLSIACLSMIIIVPLTGCKEQETGSMEEVDQEEEVASEEAESDDIEEEVVAESIAELKIGIMTMGLTQTYFVDLSQGYKDFAEEFDRANVEVVEVDPNFDATEQVSGIENLISLEVDGMIITAIDPPVISNVIEEAMQKDIKIISHYNKLSSQNLFSGVSTYGMGYIAGQTAAKWINEKYAGEEIEVALLIWDKTEFDIDRTNGMKDALAMMAPNANIVAEQAADTIELGINVSSSILQANPDVKCFVCYNDDGGLGALAAVEEAGLSSEEVGIFGVGASDEPLAKIKEGTSFKGTASIDPYSHGRLEMEMALRLLLGDFMPSAMEIYPVPVTEENVEQFIK